MPKFINFAYKTAFFGNEVNPNEPIDYSKASGKENIKRKLANFFENFKYNLAMNTINSLFSMLLVFHYILSTFNIENMRNTSWGMICFILNTYFLFEFIIRLYSSKNPKIYLFSQDSLIDIFSITPYYIVRFNYAFSFFEEFDDNVFDLANIFSFIRIMKIEKCLLFIESEINKQLLSIILIILTLILFCAGFLQFAQRSQNPSSSDIKEIMNSELEYNFYIYLVMTIVSTEGYENPFKKSLMKILIIVLIILAILIIPKKSSELITLLSSKSIYARKRYKVVEETPHIVITGTVSTIAAHDFFQEFFHKDHGGQPRDACLLINHRPDSNMENLIKNPTISSNVFYIQGDPLKEKDLKRCQIEKAKAIIILCDKQSGDANQEDSNTILKAMMIKKYLDKNSPVKICMEILRPEGKTHYYLSLNKQTRADQVICVDELKLSLLAKSCLCPGLVALISNLITSSGEPKTDLESKWLEEYWKGKRFEIYKTSLSSKFFGKTFSWVAANIYKNYKAILLALEINQKDTSRIFPNPGDFVLPFNRKMTGYIIAEDKSVADKISCFKLTELDKNIVRQKTLLARKSFPLQHGGSFWNETEGETDEDDEKEKGGKIKQENLNNYTSGEWSKIEEKCHISKSKINLQDINFLTMENNILATNHIILCGLVPNLINFVMPLRAKYLIKYPPIVILHSKEPTEKQWSQIAYFPELYYVKGTAMNTKDLLRANIFKASKVVILAPNVEEVKKIRNISLDKPITTESDDEYDISKLTRDEEDLLDARTIFKYKTVKKIRNDIPIVTELVCPNNLLFLLPHPEDYALMKKHGIAQTPAFASGEIYFSSVVDSLICQAYYNSSLITVLNQLLVGNVNYGHTKKNDEFANIKTSNLYHLPVSKAFIGQPFEKLFTYLTKHQNILPLGLYRLPNCRDNKYPYVCTNPDPNTILTDKDLVFVLAQQSPSESSVEWGAPFEKLDENKLNNATLTDDVIFNYDETDKDLGKNNSLFEENKKVYDKIGKIVIDLKNLRNETNNLYERLSNRHNNLLEKVRGSINEKIKELMPDGSIQANQVIYDDEDMKTGSSPSSIDENANETELEGEKN